VPIATARLLTVSDAFLSELATFLTAGGVTETPTRVWKTNYDLEQLETTQINVVAASLEADIDDRGGHVANLYGFNVTVQKKMDVESATFNTSFDELVNLLVAIYENWPQEGGIASVARAVCVSRDLIVFSPEFLASKSQFFGVATFVFREVI
jgi:hypothetical protein